MGVGFRRLHPVFAASVSPVDLRQVDAKYERELRRVTTLDVEFEIAAVVETVG